MNAKNSVFPFTKRTNVCYNGAKKQERRIDDMDTQHLLQAIKEKLADMTEEQKQKVMDILLAESSEICDVERGVV